MWFQYFIDTVFGIGLFINSMLFIPQAIRIWRQGEAKDLSMTTFIGFWLTQITAIIYGYLHHDYILMFGYILAAITCGFVTAQIIIYRIRERVNVAGSKSSE